MIMTLYEFPNPNNGDRYDLSQEELDALLYRAYMNGYQWGKEAATPVVTTSASTLVEDKDDNTNWKEVWIK